ncbi:uncharacterized protein LOC111716028 isoform X2 [Eurytemora carolleeae]|uniref:uncharacterized protein LOC111716028 isoform X2 n=1 Tax=Eurytemora carolleeae TaxID=1294199 RepID=UPI000C7703C5|nr:uncharacterized protein LOC111716028 isoform X2 [Eurytemora carolleeae]|eukprot:XP_023347218.1 uncharacterized protein LOC111716028 isoform X2 [Eurytemora affinis]
MFSKSECEKNCPPVQISAYESVCARLRERGHCVVGGGRFFYDKYSNRCIRFTACDDLGPSVNNFGTRDECKRTCIPKSLELNKELNFTSADSLTEEEEGSTPAASIVEALLVILVLGIGMFAGVLGWRHYKAKQGIEAYNLFGNERPSSETGTSDIRAGGRRNLTFENPVYTNDMYNVHRDADRNIQLQGFAPWI